MLNQYLVPNHGQKKINRISLALWLFFAKVLKVIIHWVSLCPNENWIKPLSKARKVARMVATGNHRRAINRARRIKARWLCEFREVSLSCFHGKTSRQIFAECWNDIYYGKLTSHFIKVVKQSTARSLPMGLICWFRRIFMFCVAKISDGCFCF